ncbi:hypothetical protein HPB50_028746 [Hyalomma asiaticum]|nr:hypothetical protein HPB50_028746 [Hyalomma asiaticum]
MGTERAGKRREKEAFGTSRGQNGSGDSGRRRWPRKTLVSGSGPELEKPNKAEALQLSSVFSYIRGLKQQQTTSTPKQQAQTQPSTSKTTTQATWADRVTNKGETRGPEQSRQLPQHVNDKILTLERENALLRKELAEIKTLLLNTQQQSERAVSEPAPATPAAPAAVSTPSNAAAASRAAKRRAAEDIEDEPLTIANMNKLLEQFRAAIIAEITPIKLQLTEHSVRLEILEAGRQISAPPIAPSPMQQ